MDSTIIAALIAGITAIVVNIVSNLVISSRQTALIEYRLKQIEDSLNEIKTIPERVTILETKMNAVEDALKEMRIS